ncbi:MAG: S8 family serine peptidase [Lewinellaceae bacterium]|nr:S8 family serine peptidase [Lewinellaceae bacterium]
MQTLNQKNTYYQQENLTASACNDCPNPISINDPWGLQSWDVSLTGYSCAWTITQGNPNVTVAIADTEFDEAHPDLVGKLIQTGDDSSVPSGCYHGTSVAGMVATNVNNGLFTAGVGNQISLAGFLAEHLNPSSSGCRGNPFPAVWAAHQAGYKIINMSWGNVLTSNPTLTKMVKEITDDGVLFVCAAGPNHEGQYNTTEDHKPYNQIPGVVIVTAHQHNTYVPMAEPHYAAVDLSAPGRSDTQPLYGIQPSWHDTGLGPGIGTRDGTSTAAPIVAGTAGLMLSVNPCLTNIEIEAILKATAKPNVNYDPATMGAGYLCAYDAVAAAADLLSPDPGDVHVYDDEVWDQPRSIGGNVIVHPFARLTIRSLVRFNSTDSKIVVNARGTLELENALLSRGCDNDYWDGIEVLGVENTTQLPSGADYLQGRVIMKNTSISFAKTGISLYDRKTYTQGGSILEADGSTFKNCQRSIGIAKYRNFNPANPSLEIDNLSVVSNCTFLHDNEFPFTAAGPMLFLDRVKGVLSAECRFEDRRSQLTDEALMSTGIYTSNAQFLVEKGVFRNLRFGIFGYNISSVNTFSVQSAQFYNNHHAVHARAVDLFKVENCYFNLGSFPHTISSIDHPERVVGLFVDHCTGFKVTGNQFEGPTDIEPRSSIGICVRNSNVSAGGEVLLDYNEIYDNLLYGLLAGNIANGNNAGDKSPPTGGLHYLCNDNLSSNPFDFVVAYGEIAAFQQGDGQKAAGNKFSGFNFWQEPYQHFDNSLGNDIAYFYDDQGAREEPVYFDPAKFSKQTAPANLCLPKIISGDDDPDTKKSTYWQNLQNFEQLFGQIKGNPHAPVSLQRQAADAFAKYQSDATWLAQYYLDQASGRQLDSVGYWLAARNSLEGFYGEADALIQAGDFQAASTRLSEIGQIPELTAAELAEHQLYASIKQMDMSRMAAQKEYHQITAGELSVLQQIADQSDGKAALLAQNWLNYAFGAQYLHVPQLPEDQQKEGAENPAGLSISDQIRNISVYPNPANDEITFQFAAVRNFLENSAVLRIYNAAGKMVLQQILDPEIPAFTWNVSGYQQGMYYYRLITAGGALAGGSFTVIK